MPKIIHDIQPNRPERNIDEFLAEQRTRKSLSRGTLRSRGPVSPRSRKILWVFVFISIIVLFGAVSTLFSTATISAEPKKETFSLEDFSITLSKNDSVSPFELMVAEDSVSSLAVSGIAETSELTARGMMRIYNTTTRAERFAQGTLVRGTNGKLYKMEKAVTVPAQTKDIPGSAEVGIVAERVGRDYNADPMDFAIEKYKNTSKSLQIYGRSALPITGGESGLRYVLAGDNKVAMEQELDLKLRDRLVRQVRMQLPEGYLFYEDLALVESKFDESTLRSETTSLAPRLSGKMSAIIINERALTKAVAQAALSQYDKNEEVKIPEVQNLSVKTVFPIGEEMPGLLIFQVSGSGEIVWVVPEDDLRTASVGISKKEFSSVLRNFPSMHSAHVRIMPFWVTRFPSSPSKIDIKVLED